MGDVSEGAAVDKGRSAFQGLNQVRVDGILEQGGHGAFSLEVSGCHGATVEGIGYDDAGQALLKVGQAGRQAEDRHDFRSDGDVVAVFAWHAVNLALEAVDDMTQLAVVHVDHPFPGDATAVDA